MGLVRAKLHFVVLREASILHAFGFWNEVEDDLSSVYQMRSGNSVEL